MIRVQRLVSRLRLPVRTRVAWAALWGRPVMYRMTIRGTAVVTSDGAVIVECLFTPQDPADQGTSLVVQESDKSKRR